MVSPSRAIDAVARRFLAQGFVGSFKVSSTPISAPSLPSTPARSRRWSGPMPPPLTGEAAWLCRFCPVYTLSHSLPDIQEVA